MDFSQWVLSIVGVVMLTLIVDIVLPEGDTNKYIKSIFAIVTVFIIVSPLPKLINGDINMDNMFHFEETVIDTDYLDSLNNSKIFALETDCMNKLSQTGYKNVEINITAEPDGYGIQIKKISANIKNLVIDTSFPNIFSVDKLIETISNITGVDKKNISVTGG